MKRAILLVFLFTCLLPYPVSAQQNKTVPAFHEIDSLQAVLKTQNDDTNKVNILNGLSAEYEKIDNFNSALSYAENAQALAEKIRFKKGVADAFENIGGIYFDRSNYQKALEYQYKGFTIYQDIGNKKGIAATLNNIGLVYYTLGNYSKALECYFKVLTIAQKNKNKNAIANVFCNIGIIYGEQGSYSKALEYLFKSLGIQIEMGNKVNSAIVLDDIGDIYLLRGDYAKALEYNFKAVTQVREVEDRNDIANFLGNIGNIYYEQGNYIQALECNFKAATIAREIGDIDEVASICSNTGEVYTQLKNYKQAKTFLDSALILSQKTGDKKYIENTYCDLSALDSLTGNYRASYSDYIKYIAYRDSILNQGTMQLELSYEFEKREDSIRAEYKQDNIVKVAEIHRKKVINESAIALLALTVLSALLFINGQQIKRKKDKIISEKEKKVLKVEKQHMAEELLNAKRALDDHTKSMAEKNELLEQFKVDIEELKEEVDEKRMERLMHLNKTTILTEEDWNKFKELFEQVHKGFFTRLKEKLPDLTQAEIRLICLTKLKLGTMQMSNILGISPATIWQTRYRLRKKIALMGERGIDYIVESV